MAFHRSRVFQYQSYVCAHAFNFSRLYKDLCSSCNFFKISPTSAIFLAILSPFFFDGFVTSSSESPLFAVGRGRFRANFSFKDLRPGFKQYLYISHTLCTYHLGLSHPGFPVFSLLGHVLGLYSLLLGLENVSSLLLRL